MCEEQPERELQGENPITRCFGDQQNVSPIGRGGDSCFLGIPKIVIDPLIPNQGVSLLCDLCDHQQNVSPIGVLREERNDRCNI